MIPKNLITTWISDKPAPDIFYKCFETWHRNMPGWNIKIVSIDNIAKSDYIKARLKEKNYIMASHWARIYELYTMGGIYIDIDTEVFKSYEPLLNNKFFIGHEGGDAFVNNAIMGSVPGHPFCLEMLKYTEDFPLDHPECPNETGPRMVTKLLQEKGWSGIIDQDSLVGDIQVYNSKYFYPVFWDTKYLPELVSPDSYSAHHFWGSWEPEEVRIKQHKERHG